MGNNNGFDNGFEKTEDFSELIDEVKEVTENLDNTINELNTKLNREIPKLQNEIHISDIDEDFSDILKKRKIKRSEKNEEFPTRVGRKRKLKKWVYLVFAVLFLVIGIGTYVIIHNKQVEKKLAEEKAIIDNIKSHYFENAVVTKDTMVYELKNGEYNEVGHIYKGANVELIQEEIKLDTKYFHIKDLDYYVSYEDVGEGKKQENDTRYKNYLPFNKDIVTKDKFTMYLGDEKLITLNKEMEFPIIINDYENKYYVEYNNMLVSISKDDVSKTVEKHNTDKKNQAKMTTLAYHRVYDTTDKCTDDYVCIKKVNFDKQMKYLSDNNYFTLTLTELYMYLKGNIQIEKGIVLTFDDGYLFKATDEVLDKYGLNGTMFVISGAFSNFAQFEGLKAIDIQSHTHNMHRNYVCAGGNQGGAILCAGKANIVADLKKSIETLKVEPIGLAFPFYDYNDVSIAALKEAGFKMSFVGRAGTLGKATPNVTDLYKIPRMTVWEETLMSFNTWKSYL